MKAGYVYIMASGKYGTIYLGVTSDLVKRVHEHREGLVPGFTKEHDCKLLVWSKPMTIWSRRGNASSR